MEAHPEAGREAGASQRQDRGLLTEDGVALALRRANKRVGERIIPTDTIIAELFTAVGLTHIESIRHKLKTNNSNSQVPWQERVIQQEALMVFQRETR